MKRHKAVDFLAIGRRENGRPLLVPRPSGDPSHGLISGETGSGKSVLQRAWTGAAAGLEDVALVGMDPKLTSLRPWEPRFTALATSVTQCTTLMVLLWREVFRRLAVMEAAGVDEWQPELGGPFILVVIDELTEVVSLDGSRVAAELGQSPSQGIEKEATDRLRKDLSASKTLREAQGVFLSSLARVCRSSGVALLAATQYPTVEILDSQIKANLSLRVMLRVASQEMVGVCLGMGYGSEISARSIAPSERGGCWIVGVEGRPIRGRGFNVSLAQARRRAETTSCLRWAPGDVFIGQEVEDPVFYPEWLHAPPTLTVVQDITPDDASDADDGGGVAWL